MASKEKATVAVYKFSSCDGCQLSLLNLEDELLDLAGAVEIAFFLEARRRILPGPYDVGIVEGSITTPEEAERAQQIRRECGVLIAIGTCATAGGVQALRNFADVEEYANVVYSNPEYFETLTTSTAFSEHVKVDNELWGCPVNKYQMLEAITALLQDRKPNLPQHALCLDCKLKGISCLTVSQGIPCLGPITKSGCGAICMQYGRGCYGCFGPYEQGEFENIAPLLKKHERYPDEGIKQLRTISGNAPQFIKTAEVLKGVVKQ